MRLSLQLARKAIRPTSRIYVFDIDSTLVDANGKLINKEYILQIFRAITIQGYLISFATKKRDPLPQALRDLIEENKVPFCEELYINDSTINLWSSIAVEISDDKPTASVKNRTIAKTNDESPRYLFQIDQEGKKVALSVSEDEFIQKDDKNIINCKNLMLLEILFLLGLQPRHRLVTGNHQPIPTENIILCDDAVVNCKQARSLGYTVVLADTFETKELVLRAKRYLKEDLAKLNQDFNIENIDQVLRTIDKLKKLILGESAQKIYPLELALFCAIRVMFNQLVHTDILQNLNNNFTADVINHILTCWNNYKKHFPQLVHELKALDMPLREALQVVKNDGDSAASKKIVMEKAQALSVAMQRLKIDPAEKPEQFKAAIVEHTVLIDQIESTQDLYLTTLANSLGIMLRAQPVQPVSLATSSVVSPAAAASSSSSSSSLPPAPTPSEADNEKGSICSLQ